jgi:signal transduction histidine kinase/DNA-binding response OmpR family regulator/HPt (histidine-containing phosphotransfer) domain-containing protein
MIAFSAHASDISVSYFKDPSRTENFQTFISKIDNKAIPLQKHNSNSALMLGSDGTPHWIVIDIQHPQLQEPLTLDFGNADNGRTGFVNSVILFNRTSGQTLMNSGTNKYYLDSKIAIPFSSKPQQQFILYIDPIKNQSLSIHLNSESLSFLLILKSYSCLLLFLAFTLFVASHRNDMTNIYFSLSLLPLLIYNALHDYYIFIPAPLGHIVPSLCIIIAGAYLYISLIRNIKNDIPLSLPIGGTIFILILNITGLLLQSSLSLLSSALIYLPISLVSLIGTILLFKQTLKYKDLNSISRFFVFLSFLLLCIIIFTANNSNIIDNLLITQNIIPISSFLLFSSSVLSIVHTLLAPDQRRTAAAKNSKTIQQDENNEDWIQRARDVSEQKRLLQVLQQERSLMTNLQESESRRVEEMRLAKEAADEANRAKSAFLAVVSHEIRTPMTGIMGMVRLLLDTQLTKDQKEFTNTIQDSGEALLSLLNDILDFEKIESGKMEFEKVDFDLHRLLKGIQTLMSGHAAAKNITLELDIDPQVPEAIVGDPTRIRQILLNLVNNAIKFTPKGVVRIQARDLTADKSQPISQLYIGVQDSGIGISPEAQKKIFTPFAQADSSTSRKYGGTGLGLTICKRLIEAMGGQIGINSREGEGSTFFFTMSLPKSSGNFDRVVIDPAPATCTSQTLVKPIHILVVDDNGINQKVLSGLLAKDQHHVYLASNADETMSLLSNQQMDLILMDIQLPGKNGFEVTFDIRNLPDQKIASTPIVAMTGNTSDDDVKACFDAGMNDFLGKPISPELLSSIIIKTISGQYDNAKIIDQISGIDSSYFGVGENNAIDDEDAFTKAVKEIEAVETETTNNDFIFENFGLNKNILTSLTNTLGIVQTRDLLNSFYETTESIITELKNIKQSNDFESINARAHELKGMASNFGFEALAKIGDDIERASKEKDPSRIQTATDQLSYMYETSRDAVSKWLA